DLDHSGGDEELPLLDPIRVVQLEQAHGHAAAGCQRVDTAGRETEVLRPPVAARVEEWHNGPGFPVDRGQITPFKPVAECAGHREIVGIGGAAVLFGDDVVDFVRREGHRLRDEAILAAVPRAQPHPAAQLGRDVRPAHGASPDWSLSAAFALAIRTRCSTYLYFSHSRSSSADRRPLRCLSSKAEMRSCKPGAAPSAKP